MAKDKRSQLRSLISSLADEQVTEVLQYTEFLLSRSEKTKSENKQPQSIPRPQNETVIAAIKRLKATYPMLDAQKLLSQTTELMNRHLLQGQETTRVIDELEALFKSHYEQGLQ